MAREELVQLAKQIQEVGSGFAEAVGKKLTPATLEEKLEEVKAGVEDLNEEQIEDVDKLIERALNVQQKKQGTKFDPKNTHLKEKYKEEKAEFNKEIAEITDPKVARIAKLIKEKSKEGDDLEEIEERLEALKKGVEKFLTPQQKKQVDEWINLANEVQEKKKEAQNSTGFAKEAAEKAYQEKKAEFKQVMNAAIDGDDDKLAEIAKIIKKKSNNHDDFDDVQENLKSMFSLDKDQPFHKMTEGELLGEIIFRLLMLIFSGLMAGKYLASEKWHESDVERLLRKANDATDPNQQSMYLSQAASVVVNVLSPSGAAPGATLSSSSSTSTPQQQLFSSGPAQPAPPAPRAAVEAADKGEIPEAGKKGGKIGR